MLSRLVTFYELLLLPFPHNDDKQETTKAVTARSVVSDDESRNRDREYREINA